MGGSAPAARGTVNGRRPSVAKRLAGAAANRFAFPLELPCSSCNLPEPAYDGGKFLFKLEIPVNTSIAIARVLGIVLTVMGLSAAIDRKSVSAALEKVTQDRGFVWSWSFVILTLGAVIVVMNNVWTSGLPMLITILGWLTIAKGAFLLLLPGPATALYRKCNQDGVLIFGGVVACLLGLALLYVSFV